MSRLFYYLLFCLGFIFVVMSFTSLGVITYREQLVNDLSSQATKQAASLAATLAVKEQEDQRKLEYFADLSMLRQGLESGDYTAIEELLTKLMLSDHNNVQSRLLNSDGLELFKLVNRGGRPIRLNSIELQNKAHRYYVRELFETPLTQTYFSQVDLNVDYGVLELPHRPVLRIARQIVDPITNRLLGALMFNYDMKQELERMAQRLPAELELFVIDAKQQYLLHPNSAFRYCAELPCDSYFDEAQLQHEAHQRLYFNQHLAAQVNLDSSARPVHSGSRLLVRYKEGYKPYLTQHLSFSKVLRESQVWWLMLGVSSFFSGLACVLHARISRRLYLQRQQHKTHKLLESLSQLMDGFHQSGQNWSNEHFKRLAYFSRLLAEYMELDEHVVEDIYQFAFLHDIGKFCSVSSGAIAQGNAAEQQLTEQRSIFNGYQLLRNFKLGSVAKNIVVAQHERWDGEGYPKRLVGNAIPIEARIVSLVHHFESLMTQRFDSPPLSFDTCYAIINEQSGKAFDPNLVQAFNALEPELRRAYRETTS